MKISDLQKVIIGFAFIIIGKGLALINIKIPGYILIIIGAIMIGAVLLSNWFSAKDRYRTPSEDKNRYKDLIDGYNLSGQLSETEKELETINAIPPRNIIEIPMKRIIIWGKMFRRFKINKKFKKK